MLLLLSFLTDLSNFQVGDFTSEPGTRNLEPNRASAVRTRLVLVLSTFFFFSSVPAAAQENPKAREVIAAAIEAMGGEKYLEVKNTHSRGRYFFFDRRGRKGFARFWDWTVFEPIKSRWQLGEGKRQRVRIHNLEIEKGWTLEGKDSVEEIPEEAIEEFKKDVKRDVNVILRQRVDEEGMGLFYHGPDDIAGAGEYEAVEFLDTTNTSVVIYFDLQSHLPSQLETHIVNKLGIRQQQRVEWYNWHTIQAVHTPLRSDIYVDEKISQQVFVEEIAYNVDIPPGYFLEPKPEK